MYKNLSPSALGLSGRQSELIELALTYGFKGLDVNVRDMLKRAEEHGNKHALRFLHSAQIRVGGFELPIRWDGPETEFKADLATLAKAGELAKEAGAKRCFTTIQPASDSRVYHENFEMHRERLAIIGDTLDKYNVRLGLNFLAPASHRAGREHQFIHQAEPLLALIKAINHPRVGLALDLWHWLVGGGGIDQLEELDADQIVVVRLADVPEAADLATIEDRQRLLPGDSETSKAGAVVKLLIGKDYDGPVSVFPHPSQFSGQTRDMIVQKAAACMDELWHAAGLSKTGKLALVPPPAETAAAET